MYFNDLTQLLNFFAQFGWEYEDETEAGTKHWIFSRDED